MNTNPPCRRCGKQTFGSSQWCAIHGDNADFGLAYVGPPEVRSATSLVCDTCGESFTRTGLRRHRQSCAVEVMLL